MKKLLVAGLLGVLLACNTYRDLPKPAAATDWKIKALPPNPQQLGGDPDKGLAYIKSGQYLGSGIPYAFIEKRLQKIAKNLSESDTSDVPYIASVFQAPNGVTVTNGNCFTCHAGSVNGQVVFGLGNSFSDYRNDMTGFAKTLNFMVKTRYGQQSKEWEAFKDFGRYYRAITPYIKTNNPGVNPAARLAEACVRHRNPEDLSYAPEPLFEEPAYTIASDVPPLWNVRKKNALYYTAVGRGDFTKLLFQASFLGIPDSSVARRSQQNFKDVLAWIYELKPPKYPKEIKAALAESGREIFNKNCSNCHGRYGKEDYYPNRVVALSEIQTDPLYAQYALKAPIVDWYNKSWFATSPPYSRLEPEAGYVAPPLDGIWATAPYLHNGSVPTLEDLLNSKQRPVFWKRSGDSRDYDFVKIGWQYERLEQARGKWTFDTTLPGYNNQGHYFGDQLSQTDRQAVIEYLKTL